jgi:hypothetical protein
MVTVPIAATVMALEAPPIVGTARATAMATATREATALATAAAMAVAMAVCEPIVVAAAGTLAEKFESALAMGSMAAVTIAVDSEPMAGMAVAVPKAMHETSAMDVAMDAAMDAAIDVVMATDKSAGMVVVAAVAAVAAKVEDPGPRVHFAKGEGRCE